MILFAFWQWFFVVASNIEYVSVNNKLISAIWRQKGGRSKTWTMFPCRKRKRSNLSPLNFASLLYKTVRMFPEILIYHSQSGDKIANIPKWVITSRLHSVHYFKKQHFKIQSTYILLHSMLIVGKNICSQEYAIRYLIDRTKSI